MAPHRAPPPSAVRDVVHGGGAGGALSGRFLLALAGVAVALLFAEGAARIIDRYHCLLGTEGDFWEPHPLYGWAHRPGAAGWAKGCLGSRVEWQTYTRINRLGLRDREIPYARSDAYRILVLGDSFTEGIQVDLEETFVKQLERRLGPGVEVVNGGTSGYGPDNELLFYLHEGRRYRPDLVLLAFNTGNDVLESYTPLLRAVDFRYPQKPYFMPERGGLVLYGSPVAPPERHPVSEVKEWVRKRSLLYRLLRSLDLPRLVRPAHATEGPALEVNVLDVLRRTNPPEWEQGWWITQTLVRRLRHAAERDGARFAVVVFTSAAEVSPQHFGLWLLSARRPASDYDVDKANRIITTFLARQDIPTVPLLEGFRAHLRATGRAGYFDWDPHWNAEGHALAAELIAPGLRAQGLVPVRAGT